MDWCFATVNGKLAEFFFEKHKGEVKFLGHCYVKQSDYKTKREKKYIKEDIAKAQFVYRNKEYKDKNTGEKFSLVEEL